jgi:hypothetical protein
VTQVPLDWLDPSPSHLVTIAIIRYNATDKTNYKGSIFINPGGPGGSGIWFIKHLAPYYQSVVGKNQVSHPSPPLFLYLLSLLRADVRKGHHLIRSPRDWRNHTLNLVLELFFLIQYLPSPLGPPRTARS